MKLNAEIGERKYAVNIKDGQRVFADIDGLHYEIDAHESGAGNFLLLSNNRVFDCRIEGCLESGKPIIVVVNQIEYPVTLTDHRRLRGTKGVESSGDDVARIVAPMPGKVARVLVAVGDHVNAGDGIVVVEAMKMQNEIKTPKAGTVTSLSAEPGATVNAGEVLAIIE